MKECELANEIIAIKTLVGERDKPRTVLIEKNMRKEHFADPRTKEMHRVIMALAKKRTSLPSYKGLAHAPQLGPEARELLQETDATYPPARTPGDAEQVYDVLERLRQGRVILASYKEVMNTLEPEDADPEEAFFIMEKALLDARNFADDDTLSAGVDSNIMEAVAEALSRTSPNTIPTGFRDFDKKAGGLPRGGVTVLAASSGGGKSCMAQQVGVNCFTEGYSVALVTLEMQKPQTINRLIANISEVSHKNLHLGETTKGQKDRAMKQMQNWDEIGGKKEARFKVYHKPNTSISEIALQLRAFAFDLIIVDYINLLSREDTDGHNEAQALGEIARMAKVQAGTSNAAWLILAQLNEQGIVKYSRAIKESADYLLSWTYGEAEKESHIIEVTQQKSRNSEGFKFNLRERFNVQKFENIGSPTENRDIRGVKKSKKSQRHPTAKPMPGLDFDDEDDDD